MAKKIVEKVDIKKTEKETEKMYKVHLCKGCIEMLDEHYPYMVPRETLQITEVSIEECDNTDLDNYDKKLIERNGL